jgi:hypothetical protein
MRHGRRCATYYKTFDLAFLAGLLLLVSGTGLRAELLSSAISVSPNPMRPYRSGPKESAGFTGIIIPYHSFTRSEMESGYDHYFGTVFDAVGFRGHYGAMVEAGYLQRDGAPRLIESKATIISSALDMWAIPFGGAFLYSMKNYEASSRVHPYIGIGFSFLLGGEKLSVSAKDLLERWNGYLWATRLAFAGRALAGAQIRLKDNLAAVVQAEWMQAGKGTRIDWVTDEDKKDAEKYIYEQAQRPDFDFTGWSIAVGIRYSTKGM